MISLSLTTYALTFEGVTEGTIKLVAYGETFDYCHQSKKGEPYLICLEPSKGHGGTTAIMISQSNHEFLQFLLPWGSELEYHRLGQRPPSTCLLETINYPRN